MNKLIPAVLALAIGAVISGCNDNNNSNDNNHPAVKSTVAIIGDMPYGTNPTDTTEQDLSTAFIKQVNSDTDISAVLHVGDIHSGKQYCTDTYNQQVLALWKSFAMPLLYTPGDNEWADCHKVKEGGGTYNATTGQIDYVLDSQGHQASYQGGNPAANLTLLRNTFFSNPGNAVVGNLKVHSQANEYNPAYPADKNYAENVWLEKSGVMIVTLNIPGGSNNDNDIWYGAPNMSAEQANDIHMRSEANKRWLNTAFQQAIANGDKAVLIQTQADMWDADGAAVSHIAEYKQFIDLIASNSKTFAKPVLLVNGDSHVYRSDNPLVPGAPCVIEPVAGSSTTVACAAGVETLGSNPADPYQNQPNGYNVPNFHRITVHGSTTPMEYLKLVIDPSANASNTSSAFGPFSWTRVPQKVS